MPHRSRSIPEEEEDDIGWQYGSMIGGDRRKTICKFCGKQMHGGGITRLKHHLAGGQPRGVSRCDKVPPQIRRQMQDHLAEKEVGKKKKLIEMQH